jgi:hypothetical protein
MVKIFKDNTLFNKLDEGLRVHCKMHAYKAYKHTLGFNSHLKIKEVSCLSKHMRIKGSPLPFPLYACIYYISKTVLYELEILNTCYTFIITRGYSLSIYNSIYPQICNYIVYVLITRYFI